MFHEFSHTDPEMKKMEVEYLFFETLKILKKKLKKIKSYRTQQILVVVDERSQLI